MVRSSYYQNVYLQFTMPFTVPLWVALGIVMLCSGFYIYVMEKWNPFKDSIDPNARFTGRESFWHSYLIITQVGAPFGVHTYSTRVFSVFYWFFALFVVGCYTANLASFLIASEPITPEISIETLPQSGRRYGILANSSVSSKYASNKDNVSSMFYETISERGDFVNSYEEGTRRVKEEDFILFGTSLVMTANTGQFILLDSLSDYFINICLYSV